ncbi:hypothetical protein OF83DRAFT_1113040 [Amylostereum chailletii]|nr:hypothetical protein OF83DRAFT_1113040 [Amylostereum chailletii]
MSSDQHTKHWNTLLEWLEQRGMHIGSEHLKVYPKQRPGAGNGLFASEAVSPHTPLFTLPASAKMNVLTLRPHYPDSSRLSATQIIALHLLRHRPQSPHAAKEHPDPLFGAYISVLPRDFDSHPLTWIVNRTCGAVGYDGEGQLLDLLTPSAILSLDALQKRFWKDWDQVKLYMDEHTTLTDIVSRDPADFLWAWLNVNTRCLYDDIGQPRSDNISLCPIFDFANHVWARPTMQPLRPEQHLWTDGRRTKSSELTCATLETIVERDQEVFLSYGGHSNLTLFVEYGFVNTVAEEGWTSGAYPGEVIVDDVVKNVLDERGELGLRIKDILEGENYWGDWTMHLSPPPAHPSYRLLTALRLYHVFATEGKAGTEAELQLWRDTVRGLRDVISCENEERVRATLVTICGTVVARARTALAEIGRWDTEDGRGWVEWQRSSVRRLWAEEAVVASAVVASVNSGAVF